MAERERGASIAGPSDQALKLRKVHVPHRYATEARSLWTERREPGLLAQSTRRLDVADQRRMDRAHLGHLLQRRAPDLLLRGVAEPVDPLVMEVEQVAGFVEPDRERVRQQ